MRLRASLRLLVLLQLSACHREIPVLLYHEVGCATHDDRDLPADQLDAELTYLETHGYHLVTVEDALHASASLPGNPVAITFDDGAACVYSAAFPVLQRHHAPFELFLVSDWIAADAAHRSQQPVGDGEQVQNLIWPEVRAMVDTGLAHIGAHGRNHTYLRRADLPTLESEIAGSRKDLAAALGRPIELFAYPYGAYNLEAMQEVRLAGFTGALAVGNGLGGRFAYRRRSVHRGASEAQFADMLEGGWILPLLNHN
jgi:peptidoglycan/xylan/chitin deacetylase (PgdA/CDA1 family)